MALLAWSAPSIAHAHLVNSGVGPFYDGAIHLLLSPTDVIRLIALSLLAGAQRPASARAIVLAAPIALFLTSLAGQSLGTTGTLEIVNRAALFLIGAAIAADLQLPPRFAIPVAAAYGGLFGFQNGIEIQVDDAGLITLLGTTAVATSIIVVATALVVSATAFPLRVACRVLGSWTAAVGLLSLGWVIARQG
ncbi:HupE/UreJ family protein [Ensifer sp. B1-9]|uniref:HupE/UreJ family protein n=1 Tax=Ensifer sp. B1-9 TaxID=3141455 RepID=UPI003D1C003D